MKARNLEEAIRLVNQTGYGLTSGLESLDDREQKIWIDGIRAGNLYVNRSTTGAIVLRQPFGGMGKSAFGPGIKAGGPNYVAQLMQFRDKPAPVAQVRELDAHLTELLNRMRQVPPATAAWSTIEIEQLVAAMHSYQQAMETEFGQQHDNFLLIGQDNFRRYLPVKELRIRIHPQDTAFEILARVCAAHTAGCRVTVSKPLGLPSAILDLLEELTDTWAGSIEFVEESDDALVDVIRLQHTDRLRFAAPDRVPETVRRAVIDQCLYIADSPVLKCGRVELLWYVREQSICLDYHRYGNLGARTDEPRTEPL
jgi:RHH-type proline utilization regulon transcriptional repressor/proline dehydrogenase/delta 1-pyrroline-5-carboxylate dehydrogenase